jgi:hypothetical protein
MRLEVPSNDGTIIVRSAENIVLRNGAAIIANLFSGSSTGAPINRVGVGFAKEAASTELTTLTPPEANSNIPAAALSTPLAPGSFKISTDMPRVVRVSINALFKPTMELKDVTEAGLLAGTQLYNQVVFEPVTP